MYQRKFYFSAKRQAIEPQEIRIKIHEFPKTSSGDSLRGSGAGSSRGARRPGSSSSAGSHPTNAGSSAEQPDAQQPTTDEQQHDEADVADQHAGSDATANASAAGFSATFSQACPAHRNAATGPKTDRYEAAEKNWDCFNADAPDMLFSQLSSMQRTWQLTHSIQQRHLQQAACDGECNRCGCNTAECTVLRQVRVVVVDLQTSCSIDVNVYKCSRY